MSITRYFAIMFLPLFGFVGNAQNLMHYATNPNGEMPIVLFPENSGIVQYEYSIDTNVSSDDILDYAEETINNLSAKSNYKFEILNSGRRSLSYKVEMIYGSQPLTLYPVWVFNRSATKVKFQCNIYARDGKYKFSLTNFETNRNTIHGNAKNDGDPNIIHWQRVNSLLSERKEEIGSSDINSRKARQIAYDYNCQIAFECHLYAQEWNLLQKLIDSLNNVCNNGSDAEELITLSNPVFFNFDVNEMGDADLYGNLVERFTTNDTPYNSHINSSNLPLIYVSSSNESHELAGRNEIIKNIVVDKIGYITFDKSKADFSINYMVDTSGKDKAIVEIYGKNGNLIGLKKKGSSESDSENREVAESLYNSFISKTISN